MEKIKFIKEKKFETLPKISGVYFFYNKKELLYIGKAVNIKNRVKNHFFQPSYRDKFFTDKIDRIGFIKTNSEIEALILEANLIKKYQPKFNIVWRDDKNYFYVAIFENKNKIPYVFITHQPKPTQKAKYIGPFVEGTALKRTIRFLRKAFPYYINKTHPKNKCTWCHLDLCPGPYEELLSPSAQLRTSGKLDEYKNNIKKLILVLRGKSSAVLRSLKKEMKSLAKENRFEEAGKVRDKIYALQYIMSHTSVISTVNSQATSDVARLNFQRQWEKTQKNLQIILNFNQEISRIECYDISNIQGKFATGSMVVFKNGKPEKNQYKKFKIKATEEPNDILMLKEVLQRRFDHKKWEYPQVILIDGGKAQLNAGIEAKKSGSPSSANWQSKKIKIMSIAKRNKELFVEGEALPVLLKSLPREIYNLILQLDSEAHRFAIAYHKKLRKKNLLK